MQAAARAGALRLNLGTPQPHEISDVYSGAAVVGPLGDPANATLEVLLMLFVVAGVARVPRLARVAPLVWAAASALLSVLTGAGMLAAAVAFASQLVLAVTLWRGGALHALVACLTSEAGGMVLPLFQAATARYAVTALALLLVCAAPGLLALRAHRRFGRAAVGATGRAVAVPAAS
jgi:hypothetical protein